MEIRRPVLRYFGGKYRIAPWIVSLFPEHEIYVEAFAGAASVLMRKPRARVEVYNDLDGEIVNVFRVLRDKNQSLILYQSLLHTPYSREEYYDCLDNEGMDSVDRARRTIVKAFFGYGSDSVNSNKKSGFRARNSNSNRHAALDWLNYPPEIEKFCERLAGVTIEQKDALELIPLYDSPRTLFYLDPPYVHETRGDKHNYRHEMRDECHERLLALLKTLKGMVVLSGYQSPLYDSLGWRRFELETLADGARPRLECAWVNPACLTNQNQMELCL